MKREINWNEIAKVEMRPGAPERPTEAVKTIVRHAPTPQTKEKPKPAGKASAKR